MARYALSDGLKQAIAKTNRMISMLKKLNEFQNAFDESAVSSIVLKCGKEKVELPVEQEEMQEMLERYRKNYVSQIRTIVKKNKIELTDSDISIVNGRNPEKKVPADHAGSVPVPVQPASSAVKDENVTFDYDAMADELVR